MIALAHTALKRCDELAELNATQQARRQYLSPEHRSVCERIAAWMEEADLTHWQDAAGNLWGRLPADQPDAPVVILGSHLDAGSDSGRYDGTLGVVLPLLVMAELKSQGVRLPFHLDLAGFGDDKASRFGNPLPGSRATAGSWDPEWSGIMDADGLTLAEAFTAFGLDIEQAAQAARPCGSVLAYLETNLEQGPVLEAEELPIGIVSAIAGTRRFYIEFTGQAGHAGRVPMHLRQDALAAAAEFTLIVERVAREHGVTATVGRLTSNPGAANIIAGQAELTLDIRSEVDSERDAALDMIWETAKLACQERYIGMLWEERYITPAVTCSDALQSQLAAAIERQGIRPRYLVSGADHEAIALAKLCPVALLSVRCTGGYSHLPDAEVRIEDVAIAGQVLWDWISNLQPI